MSPRESPDDYDIWRENPSGKSEVLSTNSLKLRSRKLPIYAWLHKIKQKEKIKIASNRKHFLFPAKFNLVSMIVSFVNWIRYLSDIKPCAFHQIFTVLIRFTRYRISLCGCDNASKWYLLFLSFRSFGRIESIHVFESFFIQEDKACITL